MPLFSDQELASYPGAEGIPADTAALLASLVEGRIYGLIPQATADASPIAKGIALEAVVRAYRNSDGYATESVDDWTGRRGSIAGLPGIYLTADERAELLGLVDSGGARIRSVRLRSWTDSR